VRLLLLSLFIFCSCCQSVPKSMIKRHDWEKQDLKFTDGDFTVHVERYAAASGVLLPKAIVILPPTGGTNYIDRSYAKSLFTAGFDVYILGSWTGMDELAQSDDLELHDRLYRRALRAVQVTLTQIPKGYLGVLGSSVGATFAPVIANLEPRIDAVFLIVGGAPIPSVIVHSDQGAMEKLKKKRFKRYGFKNDQEYLAALDEKFPLDPFKTPPLYKDKDLGMVVSTIDTTVPAADQMALKNLWNPQTLYSREKSHFMTIVSTWWSHEDDVIKFFFESDRGRYGSKLVP
jgi:hypothetical protein